VNESSWATKSKAAVKVWPRETMGCVSKPRAVRRKAMFQKWLLNGVVASVSLPTICVHMWSVS
jgi:hypothetical protein